METTLKKFSASSKFLIMCDIEKRAVELAKELEKVGGYTECHNIVGYKMYSSNWRDAKDAGFTKEYGNLWVGFTTSFAGNGAYGLNAYEQAIKEKKEEIGAPSFLDNVFIYEYLT